MKDLVGRLKMYMDYKRIGITDMSIILGYTSPQKLYRLFNTDNASPSVQIIEDISSKFHELNLNWLFTGRGSMIQDTADYSNFKDKYYKCLEEKEELYKKLIDGKIRGS